MQNRKKNFYEQYLIFWQVILPLFALRRDFFRDFLSLYEKAHALR